MHLLTVHVCCCLMPIYLPQMLSALKPRPPLPGSLFHISDSIPEVTGASEAHLLLRRSGTETVESVNSFQCKCVGGQERQRGETEQSQDGDKEQQRSQLGRSACTIQHG